MSDKQEYSDDESVIIETRTSANTSSGFIQQTLSTVVGAVGSALNFLGTGSRAANKQMDSEPPARPGRQQYRMFRTKNEKSNELDNKNNIRNTLSGIGRGRPTISTIVQGAAPKPPGTVDVASGTPARMPPKLSDPSGDNMPKDIPSGSKSNNIRSPRDVPLYRRRFGNDSNRSCGMPVLEVETPSDSRDVKRARNSEVIDVDADIPPPPVLEQEVVHDDPPKQGIVIPQTPPREQDEDLCLSVPEFYLGNIECSHREIKMTPECLKLTTVKPKGSGTQTKFNIKIPVDDIKGLGHYTEYKGGNFQGHYLYFKIQQQSSVTIMNTLRKNMNGPFLFDPDNHQESVKYLYMKCELTNNLMPYIMKYMPEVAKSSLSREICMKIRNAIISNTYQRAMLVGKINPPRPGQRTFRTQISHIQSSCSKPRISNSVGTPVKKPPLIELDDDDDEQEEVESPSSSNGKRSTRSSAVVKEEKFVADDEKLFVYPPDDPISQVQVYGGDLKCLKPGEYLNDNIIDFYLQYVMLNSVCPEIRAKTHIFTTFFFTKLTEAKKDSPSMKDKSTKVYDRVKKWLKRVDIFSKDYLVIPVNRSHHWFLIIVCNANKVQEVKDSKEVIEVAELPKIDQPCIIVMDSLGVVRTGGMNKLTAPIRFVLKEEWLSKKDLKKEFDHALIPDRTIKPPGQDNNYDCGLFLIKYVECFLKNPAQVLGAPTQKLGRDFLDIKEAKNLRKVIKETILDLWERNRATSITVESTAHVDDNGDGDDDDNKSNLELIGAKTGNGHSTPSSSRSHPSVSRSQPGASDGEMEIVEEIRDLGQDSIDDKMLTDDEDPIITRRSRTNKNSKDENEDVSNKSMVVDVSTDDENESTKMSGTNDTDELFDLIS